MSNIQYIGLKEFTEQEQEIIKSLALEYADKLERYISEFTLVINLKRHNLAGKRIKFSFHTRLDAPSFILTSKADDWDLARTLHKLFKKIENEIKHKFKTD